VLLKASDTSYDTAWFDNYAATVQATVRNETGATLTKGTVVYISGGAGNKPLVTKASASSESSSSKTFAILAQDIPTNQNGQAVTMGLLKGLDTTAFTAGANLWLSTTAGQIVSPTPPATPAHAVFLGNVVRVHANQGEIEVRIQNGYELGELHDVLLDDPANGQVLKYDAAQGLWINGTDTSGVAWGGITGTLSDQTDLQSALDAKQSVSGMTAYLTKAGNLDGLASLSTSRTNLGLGSLDTPTFAGVTVQGSGSNVANLGPTSLSLTHATSGSFTIQPSVGITFPDATVQTTAYPGPAGATAWGTITGTLSSQTDLQSALDGKYSTTNPAGYITSSALSGYATESWVTSQGYITSSALSPYLLSSTAASTYQTIAGMSSYLTTSAAASTYYPLTNPSGYITSSALTGYATESWVTSQGYLTSASLSGYATESWVTAGFYPLTGNPSGFLTSSSLTGYATESWVTSQGYITSAALSPYLLSTTAASTYQTISGMSSYLTTSAASTTYATILEPSVDGVLTVGPSGTNSAQVQVEEDANNYIRLLPGNDITFVSSGAIKFRITPTELRFPDASTQTVAYPGPSGFLLKADNLSGLASVSTARTNLGLGTMATASASDYSTTSVANGLYYPLSSNPAGYLTTAPVTSVAGRTGAVTLSTSDISGLGTAATYADTAFAKTANNLSDLASASSARTNLDVYSKSESDALVPAASTTTAGKVELATLAEIITGTDTGRVVPVSQIPVTTASPYLRSLTAANATAVFGSGAVTANTGTVHGAREAYLNSTAVGRASFSLGLAGAANAMPSWSTANFGQINFSNKIVMSGTTTFGITGYAGNANTCIYVTLGGYTTNTVGAMTQKGIGIKKVGGTSNVIELIVHNGTSQTAVSSSTAPALAEAVNWTIYSDGTGNVTLYINGTQAATTSSGPTGSNTAGYSAYREQVECPSGSGATHSIHSAGGWVYIRP
jgi:hypothetical protein